MKIFFVSLFIISFGWSQNLTCIIDSISGNKPFPSGSVTIYYTLTNSTSSTLSTTGWQYSEDNSTWQDIELAQISDNFPHSAGTDSILWDTQGGNNNLNDKYAPNVYFRMKATDGVNFTDYVAYGPFEINNVHNPKINITSVTGESGNITIHYSASDPDNNNIMTTNWAYSRDGNTWNNISSSHIYNNIFKPTGNDSIRWESDAYLDGVDDNTVYFRMDATDGNYTSLSKAVSPAFPIDNNDLPVVTIYEDTTEYTGDVPIKFRLHDSENDKLQIACQFSLDGRIWKDAFIATGSTTNLYRGTHTITWQARADVPSGTDSQNIHFRIIAKDNEWGEFGVISGIRVDYNRPPTISVNNIYYTATNDVSINYQLSDDESDLLDIDCFYSKDSGKSWRKATTSGQVKNIDVYSNSIVWNSLLDIPNTPPGGLATVRFKIIPSDKDEGAADSTQNFQLQNNLPTEFTIDGREGDRQLTIEFNELMGDEVINPSNWQISNGLAVNRVTEVSEGGRLVIGKSDGRLSNYEGNSAYQTNWALGSNYYNSIDIGSNSAPSFVDIDDDNDLDMFIGESYGTLNFYRNDGNISNPYWVFISSNYNSIDVGSNSMPTFADIDDDGDMDMFIGEYYGRISHYRNDGSANTPSWVYVTNYYASIDVGSNCAPTFADIDDDGDLDLFIGDYYGRVFYYRNNGSASSPSWVYVTNNFASVNVHNLSAPSLSDADGDGDLDLFVGNNGGLIYYYRNDGSAASPQWTYVTYYYNDIDVGSYAVPTFADLDNDKDLDLFIGNSSGIIYFYQNNGNTYALNWDFGSDYYGSIDIGSNSAPVFADIDDDGDDDMFIGEYYGTIYFYRNDGDNDSPLWTYITNYYGNIDVGYNNKPAFTDIDSDGDLDLFIGENYGSINYFRNDGNASSPIWSYIENSIDVGNNSAPVFVDIDDDGDKDMFSGEYGGRIIFYQNNGSAAVPIWSYSTNYYNSIDVGYNSIPEFIDIDSDGDLDFFIGNDAGTVYFYRNDGNPSTPQWTLVTNYYNAIDIGSWSAPKFWNLEKSKKYVLVLSSGQQIPNETIIVTFKNGKDAFGNSIRNISRSFSPDDNNNNPSIFLTGISGERTGTFNINYQISDAENDTCYLQAYYSINNGQDWLMAGNVSGMQNIYNYSGYFTWNTVTEGLDSLDIPELLLQVIPYNTHYAGVGSEDTIKFHLDNNYVPSVTLKKLDGLYFADISVDYQLSDRESDVLRIKLQYRHPNGSWYDAQISGQTSGIQSSSYNGALTWHSKTDLPDAGDSVQVRVIPYDNDAGQIATQKLLLNNIGKVYSEVPADLSGEQHNDVNISYKIVDPTGQNQLVNLNCFYSSNNGQSWQATTNISGETENLDSSRYTGTITWHSLDDLPGIDSENIRFKLVPETQVEGFSEPSTSFHLDNNEPPSIISITVTDTCGGRVPVSYRFNDVENDGLSISGRYRKAGGSWQETKFEESSISGTQGTAYWLAYTDLNYGKHTNIQLEITASDNDPGTPKTTNAFTVDIFAGDYDGDRRVNDMDDLVEFTAGWRDKNLNKEIGPATGTLPYLIPQKDDKFDFEDLAVFTQMWNWFYNKGENKSTIFKPLAGSSDELALLDMTAEHQENFNGPDGVILQLRSTEISDAYAMRVHVDYDSQKVAFQKLQSIHPQFRFAKHKEDYGLIFLDSTKISKEGLLAFEFTQLDGGESHFDVLYEFYDEKAQPIGSGRLETSITMRDIIPKTFAVKPAYPNPFNPQITLEYQLPEAADVKIVIYDVLGRLVQTLQDGRQEAAYYKRTWDATDEAGRKMSSGLYFVLLQAGPNLHRQKVILIK